MCWPKESSGNTGGVGIEEIRKDLLGILSAVLPQEGETKMDGAGEKNVGPEG